jgi:single-stranded-DNA-specific exonuclease
LDLVALGTIADVAPVSGLNRILLSYGLKEIEQTARFGLRLLKKRANCDNREISYGSVAFFLAPRLNAAGRIDEADPGFDLLLEKDPKRANQLADELERRNSLRQRIEEKIIAEAIGQIESLPDFKDRKSIVVAGKEWHPGVIGIVAQRLREKYFRPAFVISLDEGVGRGSGRSVNGLDLYQSLLRCRDLLTEFGGHRLACGLTLEESKLESFRNTFESAVRELASEDAFEPVLVCDAELPLFSISNQVIDDIEKLKPFGPGNSEPILVAKSVTVLDCQPRKERHLWFLLRERETTFQAMYFRAGIDPLKPGSLIDLAYAIERKVWRNEPQITLNIKDLKKLN